MEWTPTLVDASPRYLSLVRAIERDTAEGLLRPGDRLPPQRELAYRLSVGVGTVTRAYEEAERRGLITAHVGRGSFIAQTRQASTPAADEAIDLSINQLPLERANAQLAATLRDMARRGIQDGMMGYAAPVGTEAARQAGAAWMAWSGRVSRADWRRVACTVGAQQAMDQAFAALAAPGEPILCEALTYWGAKAQAEHRRNPLHGVAMDGEGLLPDALERAARETGARVVYCTPTLQNPTATVMGAARREVIAALARKLDLWLIEDDVYGHFAPGVAPLADFAPERTIYLTSLSKSVMPGLRAGYLLAPDETVFERVAMGLRAVVCTPPGLSGTIAAAWIAEGRARELAEAARAEMAERAQIAGEVLAGVTAVPAGASLHIWLPMDALGCERVFNRAAAAGLRLLDPEAPRVGPVSPHGLRIGIGAPRNSAALEVGLRRLRTCLAPMQPGHDRPIV